MCEPEKLRVDHMPSRRAFVKTSTAAAAVGWLGSHATAQEAGVTTLTKEARDKMTADQILAKLKEGNLRFREGRKIQRDFLAEQRATASGQFPAGVYSVASIRAPRRRFSSTSGWATSSTRESRAMSRTPTSSAAWSSPRSSPGPKSCW